MKKEINDAKRTKQNMMRKRKKERKPNHNSTV